jgi:hypothetical protein
VLVSGDAAATAHNVVAHATVFRLGFVADLAGITCNLFLAMALYLLLRHVNRDIASAMVIFVAVMASIMYVNSLNHVAALMIATHPTYATAFGASGSNGLVLMFLELHKNGYLIAQIFFGLWILALGYLVYKSGYFPRALGALLMAGCFGYLVDLVAKFLFPGFAPTLSPFVVTPAAIAEFWMIGYLLVRGIRVPQQS